jgi:hypothetical protein
MAGVAPVGGVSGVQALVFVDPNPQAGPEVHTGNPWPSPTSGYLEDPVVYPGQMYSLGYGEYPTVPMPDTSLVETQIAYPQAGAAGPGTPYFDATPNTHAGPWPRPILDDHRPDQAAAQVTQSWELHGDGLDNAKPGLGIAPVQDDWQLYYAPTPDGVLLTEGGQNKRVSAGWGSTDSTQNPAGVNEHNQWDQEHHRRVANGRNLPMNFLWLPGGQRPLVTSAPVMQAFPVGPASPFSGQDPAYGYGTAGGVLTMPAGEYEAPAEPYQPGPLSSQGLLEAPL